MQLDRPQQKWFAGSGDPTKLQVATFAGQEMMAITDDNGGYECFFSALLKDRF